MCKLFKGKLQKLPMNNFKLAKVPHCNFYIIIMMFFMLIQYCIFSFRNLKKSKTGRMMEYIKYQYMYSVGTILLYSKIVKKC